MTDWDDLNQRVSPGGSSGLAIISRFRFPGKQLVPLPRVPFQVIEPMFFKQRGHLTKLDGERAAKKGACRYCRQFGECCVGNSESESELKWNERLLFRV